ncbi:YheC/YheD family protein [Microaerobacter geothermalis]|uniref:YheC/YheD family endospore coat-associated protein n=1 Tax=Microaerobacter geothermalis TaxID=674972 RepID=UPI001F3770CC|nr:YheC/YheD family protein [Microaerobacter geothermalis]MCF6094620.1 YheC/YheD family protein [Microaerobacter geothermalis]
MNFIKVSIQIEDDRYFKKNISMIINQDLANHIALPIGTPVKIQFGNRKEVGIIETFKGNNQVLLIRSSLGKKLLLPNHIQLHGRYINEKESTFFLGPLIGVLVSNVYQSDDRFGNLTPFCTEICQAARIRGSFAIIFPLKEILWEQNQVIGWTRTALGWKSDTYPIPNVIYNRLSSRSQENNDSFHQFLHRLKGMDISFFNEHFLNKWQVYEAFSPHPSLTSMIPVTKKYQGGQTLQHMLKHYPSIFVKPIHGSMGRGIYRISKNNKGFLCQYSTLNGPVNRQYSSINQMAYSLSSRLGKKPYLVQQGLTLIMQSGSPIDFRALVQKNRNGKWSITSIVGRTGSNNHIVSNIASGGTLSSPQQALTQSSLPPPFRPTINTMKKIALEFANAVEKYIPGHYGELGIDLAVDHMGKIWLLEINSKPSKNEETLLKERPDPRPSVFKIIEYGLYLTGFIPRKIYAKRKRDSKRR